MGTQSEGQAGSDQREPGKGDHDPIDGPNGKRARLREYVEAQ